MATSFTPGNGGPKKTTKFSRREALLAEAKSRRINISQAAEEGVARAMAKRRAELWLEDNRGAIEGWNEYVEEHGLPLARYREF